MKDAVLVWRHIPVLCQPAGQRQGIEAEMDKGGDEAAVRSGGGPAKSLKASPASGRGNFASLVVGGRRKVAREEARNGEPYSDDEDDDVKVWPSAAQFLKHPLALFALAPKDATLFMAAAAAGAAAKTMTAPLDRIKLLMQTHSARMVGETTAMGISFFEAFTLIGKEEGLKGYWRGNLPQVIRIIPYSAAQLFSYEIYKKLFRGKDGELSILGRLAAGACAGMTSTLATYPLDVLRLRLALDPGGRTMSQVALCMLREEGMASFYSGLGASLVGIAPYIAVNFCMFDLVKKSLPEKYQKRPESSLATALVSATLATLMCYPLDTVRRQMQMKGSPYDSILTAIPGIVERGGVMGLYRGFVPNALKSLPNSSIKLTTFDTVKGLIAMSQKELQRIIDENRAKLVA